MKSVLNSLFNGIRKNKMVSSALQNKYVLYIVATLAAFNVLGYASVYEYRSLLFFVILATLVSLYSKNMIVILAVAIIGTNLLFAGYSQKRFYVVEGFENKEETEGFEAEQKEEENFEAEQKEKSEKSGFSQRDVPNSVPSRVNEEPEDRIGKRVDYASTVEKAYDNLENILGSSGMKNLTQDTQKLIKQQQSLMGTLEQMKPLISMAKNSMKDMDTDKMKEQMANATKMLEKFK